MSDTGVIINLAPTGMIPTKRMNPHVPVSANEIIEDIHEAVEIGMALRVCFEERDEGVYLPLFEPAEG